MYSPKPVTVADMLISLGILAAGWALVYFWDKKKNRDRAKNRVRRLDEFEDKISS